MSLPKVNQPSTQFSVQSVPQVLSESSEVSSTRAINRKTKATAL